MIHNRIKDDNSGDHWGVSYSYSGYVLVQIQEQGEQVRVALNLEHARAMQEKLAQAIEKVSQCSYIIRSNNSQVEYLKVFTPEEWTMNKNDALMVEDVETAAELITHLLGNNPQYSPLKVS